jgi:DNA repair protein RecN (Recombination protein N)
VLASLSIRNFVLIEDVAAEFKPGLTVLTGETGAGKTLLTRALGLLMGERAPEGLVGAGGEDALLEAVFELSEGDTLRVPADLADMAGVGAGDVVVSRRLSRSGRNRCFVNGVTVPLGRLEAALSGLIAFSGQHEHRRLLHAHYQRDVLDAFAGIEEPVNEHRALYRQTIEAGRRLEEARAHSEERAREYELLRFQESELVEAALSVGEEGALLAEQRMLASAEEMKSGLAAAARVLNAAEADAAEGEDCLALVAKAKACVSSFEGMDAALDGHIAGLMDIYYRIPEIARALRRYAEGIVVDPGRLAEVEARLRVCTDLGRKYGGSTEAAVGFLATVQERLELLRGETGDLRRVETEYATGRERCLLLARALSDRRHEAAAGLERAIQEELADLDMGKSRVAIRVTTGSDWQGLSECGADTVEFLLESDPAMPPRPLAKVASGGELSRTLLAVKCALLGVEGPETLVFDEVDAGVGGITALAVGRKLKELAEANQVIVVTHLPQVAAFADHHYRVEKTAAATGAVTKLTLLAEGQSVSELSRMMGGRPGDEGAHAHAQALKDRAASGLLD